MAQATNDNTTSPTHLRGRMIEAIERLLTALDALDSVTEDLEEDDPGGGDIGDEPHDPDTDSEPSLGWVGGAHGGPVFIAAGGVTDDREEDDGESGIGDGEGLAEQTVGEPSLGSFDRHMNQVAAWQNRAGWWGADCGERELDRADYEDNGDLEEHELSGIADEDGLAEQLPIGWHGRQSGDLRNRPGLVRGAGLRCRRTARCPRGWHSVDPA